MNRKKLLSLVLVAATTLSLVACGGKKSDTNAAGDGLETNSTAVYKEILGDFYDAYEDAKSEDVTSVSERFALMAVAEAKLLASGSFLPIYSNGGGYAISRVVPYTVDYSLWGTDEYRFHQALVTTDFIKAEDYQFLRNKWKEIVADDSVKGQQTYIAFAKQYLEGKGYQFKDVYDNPYSDNVQTWDVLASNHSVDGRALVNTYDGLMEYDGEGALQYALATNLEVSEDQLTYTFTIRDGVSWTDTQERKIADVTADDFVAGMQHCLDAKAGLESLLFGVIKNAQQYVYGECTFDEVGVKAEGNKVIYTLEKPCSYFTSMLGYGLFAPMNRNYYVQQGGKFGSDYDNSASDYTYGSSFENIAYCGPYVVTSYIKDQSIKFKANSSYWNAANINIHEINWKFNDGSEATRIYNDAISGEIAGCGLSQSNLVNAKKDTYNGNNVFDTYAYISRNDGTTLCGFVNVNRQAYENFNDSNVGVSDKSEEEKARTLTALRNKNFRLGLLQAYDRSAMNAQVVGDELKYTSLRNSYTPGEFVKLSEDVTIDINGTETKFAAGTFYGEIVQAQLDADGVVLKVWDAEEKSSDGFDGWFNAEASQASLKSAVEELAKEGVTVDAEHPIQIDFPTYTASEVYQNKGNAVKKSIEEASQGLIQVNLIDCVTREGLSYAGYLAQTGEQCNFDLYDQGGWGPDYGDPSSYLDTMLPDGDGPMTRYMGLF